MKTRTYALLLGMSVGLVGCATLPKMPELPDNIYDIFKKSPARAGTARPLPPKRGGVVDAAKTVEEQQGAVVATPAMPPALARIALLRGEPTVPFTIIQHLEATIDPARIHRAPTQADGELLLRALAARARADAVIRVMLDGDPSIRGGLRVRGRAVRYIGQ